MEVSSGAEGEALELADFIDAIVGVCGVDYPADRGTAHTLLQRDDGKAEQGTHELTCEMSADRS